MSTDMTPATEVTSVDQLVEEITAEANRIQFEAPDEVIKLFKHHIIDSHQGTGGQAFTTLMFAAGDARAMAYYNVLNLTRVADNEEFSVEALRILFREYIPLSAQFQWTCGLTTFWGLVQDVLRLLDQIETRDQFRDVIGALNLYTSALYGWVHIHFPWNIGELFPQRTAEDVREAARFIEASAS